MEHYHNSGSTPRIFLKFCTMKGADRYLEIILITFPIKSCLGQMGHLRCKMVHPHNSGSAVRIVLQCCAMKGEKKDMEIILMVFLKKFNLGQFCHFGPKCGPDNFVSASGFFVFLNLTQ